MHERKILLFILSVVIYCLYSVHMWFMKDTSAQENTVTKSSEPDNQDSKAEEVIDALLNNDNTEELIEVIEPKIIPLYIKNACSVLQVFTEKPPVKCKNKPESMESNTNAIAVVGITAFLIVLVINAVLDVIKVKEEERQRRKLNPDGERRQSLAEFANKKPFRRESSKFGLQLFQIAESVTNGRGEDKGDKKNKKTKAYTRGDSINSYLSERKQTLTSEGSAPPSIGDTSEPKLVKRQSVAKLFGGRPVPMVRRSSFPALPLNPEVQALMLGHRQASTDSDDEGDGRGRRVRLIRRF